MRQTKREWLSQPDLEARCRAAGIDPAWVTHNPPPDPAEGAYGPLWHVHALRPWVFAQAVALLVCFPRLREQEMERQRERHRFVHGATPPDDVLRPLIYRAFADRTVREFFAA